MANVSTLEAAATSGDINSLYDVIQQDPHILEDVDVIPFVHTPLHIAASAGHAHFAIEIMRLKPSFALKLNQQGFSAIHIALQNNHYGLVGRLVEINKGLVRVKGKEGLTPLHFVCQAESDKSIRLLIYFLEACPDSIEDVNVRRETALHIAVRYGNFRALQVLVGWLTRNTREDARLLEESVLNRQDEDGNTSLHISTLTGNREAVDLLINSKRVYNNAKNLQNNTALDLADAIPEINRILTNAGAKRGELVHDPNHEDELKSKISVCQIITTEIHRLRSNISVQRREAYLVVAALIVTAIYQSALSSPGGFYQADAGSNNLTMNATSSLNSTATAAPRNAAGISVLPAGAFFALTAFNTLILWITALTILILMPSGIMGFLMTAATLSLVVSYLSSITLISPTDAVAVLYLVTFVSAIVVLLVVVREVLKESKPALFAR